MRPKIGGVNLLLLEAEHAEQALLLSALTQTWSITNLSFTLQFQRLRLPLLR